MTQHSTHTLTGGSIENVVFYEALGRVAPTVENELRDQYPQLQFMAANDAVPIQQSIFTYWVQGTDDTTPSMLL